MKSKAKQKTFINNMITYAIVVVAYIVVQSLMGTGHMSSLMKGLLVPFCIYVIMTVSLNLTVGILGELSLGHAGFMCVGAFSGALFSKCMKGAIDPTVSLVIAVIIVLAMNLVGSLLISALVIFPALSAMRLFKSFRSVTISAAVMSVVSAAGGILISILAGTPVGSTIVAVDILVFLLSYGIGRALGR